MSSNALKDGYLAKYLANRCASDQLRQRWTRHKVSGREKVSFLNETDRTGGSTVSNWSEIERERRISRWCCSHVNGFSPRDDNEKFSRQPVGSATCNSEMTRIRQWNRRFARIAEKYFLKIVSLRIHPVRLLNAAKFYGEKHLICLINGSNIGHFLWNFKRPARRKVTLFLMNVIFNSGWVQLKDNIFRIYIC